MLLFAKWVTRTILQQLLTEIQLTLTRGQVVLIIFVTFHKSCIQSVKEGIKQLKDTVLSNSESIFSLPKFYHHLSFKLKFC